MTSTSSASGLRPTEGHELVEHIVTRFMTELEKKQINHMAAMELTLSTLLKEVHAEMAGMRQDILTSIASSVQKATPSDADRDLMSDQSSHFARQKSAASSRPQKACTKQQEAMEIVEDRISSSFSDQSVKGVFVSCFGAPHRADQNAVISHRVDAAPKRKSRRPLTAHEIDRMAMYNAMKSDTNRHQDLERSPSSVPSIVSKESKGSKPSNASKESPPRHGSKEGPSKHASKEGPSRHAALHPNIVPNPEVHQCEASKSSPQQSNINVPVSEFVCVQAHKQSNQLCCCSRHMHYLHFFYAFWGIVSWNKSRWSRYYKRATLCATVCTAVFPVVDLLQQADRLHENLSQIAFAIALVVSLISLRNMDVMFGDRLTTIKTHAQQHGFLVPWRVKSKRNLSIAALLWIYRVGAAVLHAYLSEDTNASHSICRCLFISLQAGMFLALVHSVSFTLIFLDLMLDAYSRELHQHLDWARGVCSWNKVQAMLHCEAAQMASCFLALQTSAALAFLCYSARMKEAILKASGVGAAALFEAPALVIALSAFLLLLKAGSITEICTRMPPVTNSIEVTADNAVNYERQYLVNFIKNSEAGFYVKGTRLTAFLVLNYCYILGAIICALFTTGQSLPQK